MKKYTFEEIHKYILEKDCDPCVYHVFSMNLQSGEVLYKQFVIITSLKAS